MEFEQAFQQAFIWLGAALAEVLLGKRLGPVTTRSEPGEPTGCGRREFFVRYLL